PRYLEAFTPAVAGVIGVGLVVIARAAGRRSAAAAALIAAGAAASVAGHFTGGTSGAAAVAFVLGITAALVAALAIASRGRLPAIAATLVLLAALAVPLATSVRLVRTGAGDAEPTGARPAAELDRLSAYLRVHQDGARYEVAGSNVLVSSALVIKDARPV